MKLWDSSALVPSTLELVCLDDRLVIAAQREGFPVRDRSRL